MKRNLAAALGLLAASLAPATAGAQPMSIVSVGAPAINCVFSASCSVTVNDVATPMLRGGFLQSRTFQGEPGSRAAGKWVYEYRINLTRATPAANVTAVTVDFGPAVGSLDFDGDSMPDEVFVVTSGALGAVGPSSVVRAGRMITFRFARPVNSGASTFFFGVLSAGEPRPHRLRVTSNMNPNLFLEGRAPRPVRAAASGEPPAARPADRAHR